jgi:hypothetical protein
MWLRNNQGYFVAEIHGAVYVTWVTEKDKAHAAEFPIHTLTWWIEMIAKVTGETVEAVEPVA